MASLRNHAERTISQKQVCVGKGIEREHAAHLPLVVDEQIDGDSDESLTVEVGAAVADKRVIVALSLMADKRNDCVHHRGHEGVLAEHAPILVSVMQHHLRLTRVLFAHLLHSLPQSLLAQRVRLQRSGQRGQEAQHSLSQPRVVPQHVGAVLHALLDEHDPLFRQQRLVHQTAQHRALVLDLYPSRVSRSPTEELFQIYERDEVLEEQEARRGGQVEEVEFRRACGVLEADGVQNAVI